MLYWIEIIYLSLIGGLYWLSAHKQNYWQKSKDGDQDNDDESYILVYVVLQFVPQILQIITIFLIYSSMERLFVYSRIRSSDQIQNEHYRPKVLKRIKTFTWTMICIYIISEVFCICGILFWNLALKQFKIQLLTITGFFLIVMNIWLIYKYCKQAGMPYVSP